MASVEVDAQSLSTLAGHCEAQAAPVEPVPAAPRMLPLLAGGPNGMPGMPNLVELPHSHPGELPVLGQDLIPGERAAEEP